MKPFFGSFFIVEQKNCPLYEVGEKLVLTEKTILCPEGKEVCLILVRDMTHLLFQFMDEEDEKDKEINFNCSGCKGLIKFTRLSIENQEGKIQEEGAVGAEDSSRFGDPGSCMAGRLEGFVPSELFQMLHMYNKTGVLAMELRDGTGKVSFREGCIINANYAGEKNQEAIFKILAENKGSFRFTMGLSPEEMKAAEIDDFMVLLMEGVKRVDEYIDD